MSPSEVRPNSLILGAHKRHKLDTQPTPQMAFYGQRNNKNKRNNGGQGSFNSKECGFVQGAQFALKNSSHPTRNPPANSPITAAKNTKDEAIICQICNKRNHTTLKCFNRFNHSFIADNIPQALAAITIADSQDSEWFPDIGASDHITSNLGNLHSLTPYHGSDGVMVGNGHTLPLIDIGETTLGTGSSPIHLKDVLLVPNIKKDLLFISKLTTNYLKARNL